MTQRLSASRNIVGSNRIPVDYPEEAQCSMPLECNVFMRRGQGAINFTRATTATVQDHEGVIRYVKSGEARFQGARRVENLFTDSEFITGIAGISKKSAGIINSSLTGFKSAINFTATGSSEYAYRTNFTTVSGNTYIISAFIKMDDNSVPRGGLFSYDANADIVGIIGGATATSYLGYTSVGNNIYRLSWKRIASSAQNDNGIVRYAGNSGKTFTVSGYELEDVTGQSIQTVGEYVSTNVLSSPFHGAMVDGVKYFNTRLDGTYIENCGYYADTSSQNLCTRSEDFTTTWTTSGGLTVTPNSVASPGTTLSSTLTLSATPGVQFISFPLTVTAQRYGLSIYMKPNGHNLWQIATSAGLGSGYANFNISNGATGNLSGYIIKTKLIRDGWYRIEVTTSTLTAGSGTFALCAISSLTNGRLPSSNGTGTSGAYVWGAQIEATTPTSYMPTYGSNFTRNDDILTVSLLNTASTKGTLSADTRLDIPSAISNLNIAGSSLRVFGSTGASPGVYFSNGISVSDGTNTNQTSNAFLPNAINKVAYGFNDGTMTISLNGVNTSGAFDGTNSFTEMCLGNATTVPRALRGTIRNVQFWKYRLSDADIATITTL